MKSDTVVFHIGAMVMKCKPVYLCQALRALSQVEDFVTANVEVLDVFVNRHDLVDVSLKQGHGLFVAGTYRLWHFGHVAQVRKLFQLENELHVAKRLDKWDHLQGCKLCGKLMLLKSEKQFTSSPSC